MFISTINSCCLSECEEKKHDQTRLLKLSHELNKHSYASDRFFRDAKSLVAYIVQLSDFSSVMLGCLPSF